MSIFHIKMIVLREGATLSRGITENVNFRLIEKQCPAGNLRSMEIRKICHTVTMWGSELYSIQPRTCITCFHPSLATILTSVSCDVQTNWQTKTGQDRMDGWMNTLFIHYNKIRVSKKQFGLNCIFFWHQTVDVQKTYWPDCKLLYIFLFTIVSSST